MTHDEFQAIVLSHLDGIKQALVAYDVPSTPGEVVTTVRAGDDLQLALNQGGVLQLEAATWEAQGFLVPRTGTVVRGKPGTHLHGTRGPAFFVPPGTKNIVATDLLCTSAQATASPVALGAADGTQKTLEAVPDGISLLRVTVPTHRGKRAFGIHATNVLLSDCGAEDVWLTGQDSQAWWVFNTPGKIRILGGRWSAGAELAMFGGTGYQIPDCVPRDIEVAHGLYVRPKEWQTDLLDQEVKNGLEVKNGERIHFHDLTIRGVWQEAQPLGAAFMLTPANGGQVTAITIERVRLEDCADGISITGHDAAKINPTTTTDILVRELTGRLVKGTGRGIALLCQRFVGRVSFHDCALDTDGTKFAEFVDATEAFSLTDSVVKLGKYGLTFGGVHASTSADPFTPHVGVLNVSGNRVTGPGASARFFSRFPQNQLMDEATWLGAMAAHLGPPTKNAPGAPRSDDRSRG